MRIDLVCMPFAQLGVPSLALTQLQAAVNEMAATLPEAKRPTVTIRYLHHDFAHYFGFELSERISSSADVFATGVGDWIFRQIAFPDWKRDVAADEQYLVRSFPGPANKEFRAYLMDRRAHVAPFLDEVIAKYALHEADVLAMTSMFAQQVASLALAAKVRQLNPRCITALGGANCDPPMGQVIARRCPQIDYVFMGPSLVSFPQFVQRLVEEGRDGLWSTPGVASQHKPARRSLVGAKKSDEGTGPERDVNELLELDYDSFLASIDEKLPTAGVTPTLLFETSRGCWWGEKSHCTFCGLNAEGMRFRAMTPENVVKTIRSILRYSSRCKRFEATDNIMPRELANNALAQLSDVGRDVLITYEVRADLSLDELRILSAAGIKEVNPGLEGLNTKSLKRVGKGMSAFRNIEFLMNCRRADVFPFWFLLVGIPGETKDVYEKYIRDFPALSHLTPPFYVGPVLFDRFSVYHREPAKFDLELVPNALYESLYPFPAEDLVDLAYRFTNQKMAPWITDFATSIAPLRATQAKWKARWDSGQLPELFFKPDGSGVFDSRSERPCDVALTSEEQAVLRLLEKPGTVTSVAGRYGRSEEDVAGVVGSLLEKKLLFAESDKLLSLVFAEKPPAMTIQFEALSRTTVDLKAIGRNFSWSATAGEGKI